MDFLGPLSFLIGFLRRLGFLTPHRVLKPIRLPYRLLVGFLNPLGSSIVVQWETIKLPYRILEPVRLSVGFSIGSLVQLGLSIGSS